MAASAHRRITALWRYLQPETKVHDLNIATDAIPAWDGSTGGLILTPLHDINPGPGINQRTGWQIRVTSLWCRLRLDFRAVLDDNKRPFVANTGDYWIYIFRDLRVDPLASTPTFSHLLDDADAADFRPVEYQRVFHILKKFKVRAELDDTNIKLIEFGITRNQLVEYDTDVEGPVRPIFGDVLVGILPSNNYHSWAPAPPLVSGHIRVNFQDP